MTRGKKLMRTLVFGILIFSAGIWVKNSLFGDYQAPKPASDQQIVGQLYNFYTTTASGYDRLSKYDDDEKTLSDIKQHIVDGLDFKDTLLYSAYMAGTSTEMIDNSLLKEIDKILKIEKTMKASLPKPEYTTVDVKKLFKASGGSTTQSNSPTPSQQVFLNLMK